MQGILDSFNYLSKMSDVNMTITGFLVPFCGAIFLAVFSQHLSFDTRKIPHIL